MNSETVSVSKLMNSKVQTDFEDQNIMSACNIMSANNIGCVIIVTRSRNPTPVGIITERNIVEILGKLKPDLLQAPLRMLMSKPLITIEESASINEAAKLMSSKGIRRLVVVDKNNQMIGILTQKDLFNAINKNPSLFSELYGNEYPVRIKEMYDNFNQYRLENLMPELNQY